MSWRDRDYSQVLRETPGRAGSALRRLPRASLGLLALHVIAFVALQLIRADSGAVLADSFALSGNATAPYAIITHVLATNSLWTFVLTIYALCTLAARLESREGAAHLLGLYALAGVLTGAVYFAVTRWWPEWAVVPLDCPIGAVAAWSLSMWRYISDDAFPLFGRSVRVSTALLAATGLFVAITLIFGGIGALAWLLAIPAGAVAPLIMRRMAVPPLVPRKTVRALRQPEPRPTPRVLQRPMAEPGIDDILEKISRSGMGSLSAEDHARLEAARQSKLRRASTARGHSANPPDSL